MGIKVQHGSEAVLKAGVAAGKAKRGEEDRARAEREQARAQEQKAREKAQQVSMDWEIQKMRDQSQRAYAREMRQEDYKLAAEDRAVEGAIERIEFSKDLDFQYKEKERIRKISRAQAKYDQVKKQIDDGLIPPREEDWKTDNMLWKLEQEMNEVSRSSNLPKQDPMAGYLKSLIPGAPGATEPLDTPDAPTNPMPTMYQEAVNDKTGEKLISRDGGKTWMPEKPERVIPPANLDAFSRDRGPSAQIRNAPFFNR